MTLASTKLDGAQCFEDQSCARRVRCSYQLATLVWEWVQPSLLHALHHQVPSAGNEGEAAAGGTTDTPDIATFPFSRSLMQHQGCRAKARKFHLPCRPWGTRLSRGPNTGPTRSSWSTTALFTRCTRVTASGLVSGRADADSRWTFALRHQRAICRTVSEHGSVALAVDSRRRRHEWSGELSGAPSLGGRHATVGTVPGVSLLWHSRDTGATETASRSSQWSYRRGTSA